MFDIFVNMFLLSLEGTVGFIGFILPPLILFGIILGVLFAIFKYLDILP